MSTGTRPEQALRLLAVANWSFATTHVAWAEARVAALRAAGVEVDVIDIDCVSDRLGFSRLVARILEATREQRYDAIMPLYGSATALLCALAPGVPLVAAFAGTDINGQVKPTGEVCLRSLVGVGLSQLATLGAREVTVPVPTMVPRLWAPWWRRRAHVVPAGVDTERFVPRPRAEARQELGLEPGPRRAGGLADGPRLVAFVAADPDARVKRRDLADAAVARLPASLDARLQVLSGVPFDDMPTWYAACDALLVTSDLEGGPVAVKEALACGLPVVSVDCGDVREVVDGLDGCCVTYRDPGALAAALAAVLEPRARCLAGPARIAEHYSLASTGRRYRAVIAAAAGRPEAGL